VPVQRPATIAGAASFGYRVGRVRLRRLRQDKPPDRAQNVRSKWFVLFAWPNGARRSARARASAQKPGKQPSAVRDDSNFAIAREHIEALKYISGCGSGSARPQMIQKLGA
jgi:hypothetical protein